MLSQIIDLVALAALLRALSNFCGLVTSLRARARFIAHSRPGVESQRKIFVIIAVFNEQAVIDETCAYFSEIIENEPGIHLLICGTVREHTEGENPTLNRARLALNNIARCRVIECPIADGYKAEQIQYAYLNSGAGPEDYLAFYDVDSRPEPAVFAEVNGTGGNACILQQHALFLQNLSHLGRKPLQMGQALYQSRWTLAHEIPRFSLYRHRLTPFVHLVGHGLFVKRWVLDEFRGIPTGTIVDDAHLGFFMAAQKYMVASLGSVDFSDNPEKFSETYRQLYGWSRGPLDVAAYLRSYRNTGQPLSPGRAAAMCITAYGYWAQWIVTSPAIILLLGAAILGRPLAIAWLIAYLADFALAYAGLGRLYPVRGLPPAAKAVGAMVLFALICSLPAFGSFFDKVLRRTRAKYKTTHWPSA